MASMQRFVTLSIGAILVLSGCAERPEVPRSEYGIILSALPTLREAQEPFPFPIEVLPDGSINDHQNCVFRGDDW